MLLYFLVLICACLLLLPTLKYQLLLEESQHHVTLKEKRTLLFAFLSVFVLLGTISAIRYEVGVDYLNYLNVFERIELGYATHTEPGFNFVVKFFQGLTLNPQWIFAFFSYSTVFFFIMGIYKQSNCFVFSVFLFIAMGFYFYSFNSIRFYLAIAIAFYSLNFVVKKQYLLFVGAILFGALFHKSILLVLPFYLLAQIKLKLSYIFILNLLGVSLFFFRNRIRNLIFLIYPYYKDSVYDKFQLSYYNILTCLVVLLLCLFFYKKAIAGNRRNNIYFNLIIFASIIYLYCGWIPEVSRVGYYFTVFNIVLITNLVSSEDNVKNKILISSCFVAVYSLFMFIMLNQSYVSTIKLLPYKIFLGK